MDKLKILVVDDESRMRKLVRDFLVKQNFDVLEAGDGEEAVELAKNAAEAGDIVTLSPACAAFDQFKNFAVRGKTFKEIVNSLR